MSMTINGHSVKTRKDELDLGHNRATGEVTILVMVGLGVATNVVAAAFWGVVSMDPIVVVVLSDFDESSPANIASMSKLVFDLDWTSLGGTVAKAGNRKLRWTEVGNVRYELRTKSK
mmetsp:Transcript_30578/g.73357  ORF Transcript_30578/g.73357 Transcript_30578/m.73357 type:complete len:117 (+) Transcript_30578:2861-3211(+)